MPGWSGSACCAHSRVMLIHVYIPKQHPHAIGRSSDHLSPLNLSDRIDHLIEGTLPLDRTFRGVSVRVRSLHGSRSIDTEEDMVS